MMKPIWTTFYLSLAAAVLLLASGSLLAEVWQLAGLFALMGIGWVWGKQRGRSAAAAGLLLFCLGAVYGVTVGVGIGWLLFGVIAALIAWDLDSVLHRWQFVREEDIPLFWQAHIRQLAQLLVLALLLASLPLLLSLQLRFGLILGFALLAIIALSQFIRWAGK